MRFPLLRRKTGGCFLALDVGSEAVKAVVFCKEDQKYRILSSALEYFNELRPFDNNKVILRVKENAIKESRKRPDGLLLSLPPDILRSRLKVFIFSRNDPSKIVTSGESESIIKAVLDGVEKEISEQFAEDSGILPQDIKFVENKILEIKIDGYEIPGILGYRGRNLEFKVLSSFLPYGYSKNFNEARIISPIKNLPFLSISDGVFLDIGGNVTQVCIISNNNIEFIDELAIGGSNFSRTIQQKLGMSYQEARIFKEKYSKRELSHDVMGRTKEILNQPLTEWYSLLDSKFKNINRLLPSDFFISGGGSQLLDIKDTITKEGREVRFIYPENFKDTIYNTEISSDPQFTNLILLLHG